MSGLTRNQEALLSPRRQVNCSEDRIKRIRNYGNSLMTPKSDKRTHHKFTWPRDLAIKKDIASIKNQSFETYELTDIRDLGGKIDKIYWILLGYGGEHSFAIVSTNFLTNYLCNYLKILAWSR